MQDKRRHLQLGSGTESGVVALKSDGSPWAPKVYCDVCNCYMSRKDEMDVHLVGARHAKNLQNRARGVPPTGGRTIMKNRMSGVVVPRNLKPGGFAVQAQTLLDACTKPLIGVHFVTEHQKLNELERTNYSCSLCNIPHIDLNSVIHHITGRQHRFNYLKEQYPEYHQKILASEESKSDQTTAIEQYAEMVEAKEPARPMKTVLDKSSKSNPAIQGGARGRGGFQTRGAMGRGQPMKRPYEGNDNSYPSKFSRGGRGSHGFERGGRGRGERGGRGGRGGSSYGSSMYDDYSSSTYDDYSSRGYGGGRGRPGYDDLRPAPAPVAAPTVVTVQEKTLSFIEMLRRIIRFMDYDTICSEEEARLSLTVSNILSEALIKYRSREIPGLSNLSASLSTVKAIMPPPNPPMELINSSSSQPNSSNTMTSQALSMGSYTGSYMPAGDSVLGGPQGLGKTFNRSVDDTVLARSQTLSAVFSSQVNSLAPSYGRNSFT